MNIIVGIQNIYILKTNLSITLVRKPFKQLKGDPMVGL